MNEARNEKKRKGLKSRLFPEISLFLEIMYKQDYFVLFFSLFPEQSVAKKTAEALLVGQKPIIEQCYKPEFLRLVPPIHSCEDEVQASLFCFAHLFR